MGLEYSRGAQLQGRAFYFIGFEGFHHGNKHIFVFD